MGMMKSSAKRVILMNISMGCLGCYWLDAFQLLSSVRVMPVPPKMSSALPTVMSMFPWLCCWVRWMSFMVAAPPA